MTVLCCAALSRAVLCCAVRCDAVCCAVLLIVPLHNTLLKEDSTALSPS